MALPNPFQQAIIPPVVNSTVVKSTQNDTIFLHGYRSTFNIDQQKEQYQQQKAAWQHEQHQQQQNHQQPNNQNAPKHHQPNQFNRNHQPNRNAAAKRNPNHTTVNAGFTSNWCDLCERGFKFPHQLEKHQSEHEKCWFENCTFEGHTQLLKKHIEVQHQSGLFQRIAKVETDEDIEKWRAERRKRYPTAGNIEARRQAQEQRLKRGERIDEPTHRFGSINNRKRAQQHQPNESTKPNVTNDTVTKRNDNKKRRRTRQRNKNHHFDKKERVERGKKNESETTQNETTTAAAAVADTAMVNTETASCVATPAVAEKMAQNSSALAAIMGMYGSDSDSNDDEVNDDEVMTAVTTVAATAATTPMIEDKKDENVCAAMDPLDKDDKLTPTKSDITENTVNLKRLAISDDDDEVPNKQTKIESDMIENFQQNMAIESDDEAPDEQPIQRQSQSTQDTDDLKLESGPTETKPTPATSSQKPATERMPKRKTVLDMTQKIRNQNTLLEKLLQKDIRHERNVLLQCVRYVVEQNFFGIGQTIDEQNNKVNSL